MTDLSDIVPGRDADGNPAAIIEDTTFSSLADLLAAEPGLLDAGAEGALARYVNHFARGDMYRVIDDPAAFEAAYHAKIAREDPNQPWQQNVMRLRDFGVPDFAGIHVPSVADNMLEFFARDGLTGLPYRVRAAIDDLSAPDYYPVPLTAIDHPMQKDPDEGDLDAVEDDDDLDATLDVSDSSSDAEDEMPQPMEPPAPTG